MTDKRKKKRRKKINTIISFTPEDTAKLKAVCEAKFMSKVGYVRKIVLPVLERDFKEVENARDKH